MRRTLAFIGATLAIVAMSAAPASAQLPTTNDHRVGLSPGFDNPSVSAAVFDGVNIDKPGRPTICLGNQGGGKDDVSGFNGLDWVDDWFSDYEEGDGEEGGGAGEHIGGSAAGQETAGRADAEPAPFRFLQ